MLTATNPTGSDIRPPYNTREKMSRPKVSAPKRCFALGAARIAVESCAIGSYGAMIGARTASNITVVSATVPAMPPGLSFRRRSASCVRLLELDRRPRAVLAPPPCADPILAANGWALLIADPGVEHRIRQVDDKIDKHVDDCRHEHRALNQREIAARDRGDRDTSQARSREDLF